MTKFKIDNGIFKDAINRMERLPDKRGNSPVFTNMFLMWEPVDFQIDLIVFDGVSRVVKSLYALPDESDEEATGFEVMFKPSVVKKWLAGPAGKEMFTTGEYDPEENKLTLQAGKYRLALQDAGAKHYLDEADDLHDIIRRGVLAYNTEKKANPGEKDKTFSVAYRGLTTDGLLQALNVVKRAISTEETRYYLNGVALHVGKEGRPVMVTTDGHRLTKHMPEGLSAEVYHTHGEDFGKEQAEEVLKNPASACIIKLAAVKAITAMFSKAEDEDVEISVFYPTPDRPCEVVIATEDTIITTTPIDGAFPDYERVIPEDNDKQRTVFRAPLGVLKTEFSGLLRMAGKSKTAKFSVNKDKTGIVVSVLINDDMDIAVVEIPCKTGMYDKGKFTLVGYNIKYLTEIVDSFLDAGHSKDDEMKLSATSPNDPSRVTCPGDENTIFVLMPVRVWG